MGALGTIGLELYTGADRGTSGPNLGGHSGAGAAGQTGSTSTASRRAEADGGGGHTVANLDRRAEAARHPTAYYQVTASTIVNIVLAGSFILWLTQ